MLAPDKNGVALISHLQKVEEVSKKTPPELQEYYDFPFPDCLSNYWEDFLQLNRKRRREEDSYSPITYLEIDAWARLNGVTVSQFWLDVIEMLDLAWLKSQNKNRK